MKNKKPELAIVLWDGEKYSADSELLSRIKSMEKEVEKIQGMETRMDNMMVRLFRLETKEE